MIKFNNDVNTILNSLTEKGYEAYVVGGAVRNYLLGINPQDYDITTNATPEEIIKVFSYTKTILTGIKFGTVTVIYNHEKYEITTYRTDGEYQDNRHPNFVVFSKSLDNDLKRRDFTVNALAYNNELIDLHNGLDDLNNKIIRCIGDPDDRFKEDALRILRAIRFACKLNFKIEDDTKKSIFKNKYLLRNIAIERINNELLEIFGYKNFEIIKEYYEIFTLIFDFISVDKKNIIINKIENLINNNCDRELIYCSFFINLNEEQYTTILPKYKLSNELKKLIKFVNKKNVVISNNIIDYRKLLKKNEKNVIINYIKYNYFNQNDLQKFIEILEIANTKCNKLLDLNIDGNDLIKLGYSKKEIGITLNKLLNLVIEEQVDNNKNMLIEYLKNNSF